MPGATVTVPSAFTVSGPVVTGVMVTLAGTMATPFSVSLVSTLRPGTTPPRGVDEPASSTATIGAAMTSTVAMAVAQLAGFSVSQI